MDTKKQIHEKLSKINDSIVSNLIFTFIKENNISYSENKNGIFFNVSLLSDDLSNKFLDYIIKLSNNNNYDSQDKILIPIKSQPKIKKKIIKPNYIDYDTNDLELLILGFSFE